MQAHVMTFKSMLDKRIAWDYVQKEIEPDKSDECLTELKIAFFTGLELRKPQVKRLLELSHERYDSHDY